MSIMIYILEDNEDRMRQFRAATAEIAPDLPVRFWRNAHTMIDDLMGGLEHASIISLDHDLNCLDGEADPGTGYDVANLLGELIPCCPVVIHTSNTERGSWMEGALQQAGWEYDRVYPFEDDWIAKDWSRVIRQRLGGQ